MQECRFALLHEPNRRRKALKWEEEKPLPSGMGECHHLATLPTPQVYFERSHSIPPVPGIEPRSPRHAGVLPLHYTETEPFGAMLTHPHGVWSNAD